jgi:hypothetical protein
MSSEDIPAPQPSIDYFPDEIVLYGVKLNETHPRATLPFGGKRVRLKVFDENGQVSDSNGLAIAVIYSYSFEGHCYRFERPKLMVFEAKTREAKGCGYDGTGYMMWRIDAKRPMMELKTSVDLAEMLVLEANMPGNRAPNTYGNSMQLAHRGGRLSRNGGTP